MERSNQESLTLVLPLCRSHQRFMRAITHIFREAVVDDITVDEMTGSAAYIDRVGRQLAVSFTAF